MNLNLVLAAGCAINKINASMTVLLIKFMIYLLQLMHCLLFIVSAHYAPISSKLSILLEKIEQLAFLKRFNDENYRSPLFGRPVGIIGHGGGTEEIIKYYKAPVLDSIRNALSYPVEMDIVGANNEENCER